MPAQRDEPSAPPEAENDKLTPFDVAPPGDRMARPRLWGGA